MWPTGCVYGVFMEQTTTTWVDLRVNMERLLNSYGEQQVRDALEKAVSGPLAQPGRFTVEMTLDPYDPERDAEADSIGWTDQGVFRKKFRLVDVRTVL